jgi:hypothetical protein
MTNIAISPAIKIKPTTVLVVADLSALTEKQKLNGNRMNKGRQFQKGGVGNKNGNNGFRRDLTIELVTQLNELDAKDPKKRLRLQRLVANLIERACHAGDIFHARKTKTNKKGDLKKEGPGDLAAILAVFDRLEGKATLKSRRGPYGMTT